MKVNYLLMKPQETFGENDEMELSVIMASDTENMDSQAQIDDSTYADSFIFELERQAQIITSSF
jgi:hypothetical protein